MLTTPHAVTGAAIGAIVGNLLLAVPLAWASHYVLDSVPHWQETLAPYTPSRRTWVRIPIDLALAVGLTAVIAHWAPAHAGTVWLGAVMGNVADVDVVLVLAPQFNRGLVRRYWDWHCRIQRETASLWGLAPQLAVIGAGLAVSYLAR